MILIQWYFAQVPSCGDLKHVSLHWLYMTYDYMA